MPTQTICQSHTLSSTSLAWGRAWYPWGSGRALKGYYLQCDQTRMHVTNCPRRDELQLLYSAAQPWPGAHASFVCSHL